MARTTPEQGIPRGIEVARFDEEDQALAAVTYLAERDFPTEHLSIVGEGILVVHDSKGRPSPGQAFLAGASSGIWIGLMGGLIAALFIPQAPLSALLIATIVSASLVLGLIRMTAQASGKGRSGGVVYARRLVATTYVLVARARSRQAIALLAERDAPRGQRPPAQPDPGPQRPAPLTSDDGSPKYGVRLSEAERAERGGDKEE